MIQLLINLITLKIIIMKKRYFITDRIIGVYFTSKSQLEKYCDTLNRYSKIINLPFIYGNITEYKTYEDFLIKIKNSNVNWKECTV